MAGLLFFSLHPLRNNFPSGASPNLEIKKEAVPLEPPLGI
jgi:hypothetical protein